MHAGRLPESGHMFSCVCQICDNHESLVLQIKAKCCAALTIGVKPLPKASSFCDAKLSFGWVALYQVYLAWYFKMINPLMFHLHWRLTPKGPVGSGSGRHVQLHLGCFLHPSLIFFKLATCRSHAYPTYARAFARLPRGFRCLPYSINTFQMNEWWRLDSG